MERDGVLDISVLVATKNEESNIARCLESVRAARETVVVDSASTDRTLEMASRFGARIVHYQQSGDWPKKRQWALDTLDFAGRWILVLDADESVPPEVIDQIRVAIGDDTVDAYRIPLNPEFLGRTLRFGGNCLCKTVLFRKGAARYERRLPGSDPSGCDMEVHENLVVRGRRASLRGPLLHHDHRSMSDYLDRHNRYSTWDAQVYLTGEEGREPLWRCRNGRTLKRWAKRRLQASWWLWLGLFAYKYVVRLGCLDGAAGAAYCWLQAVQILHTRCKIEAARRES